MNEVTAIIADDERLAREHLKTSLLRLWPQLSICGEAENGFEALKLIEKHNPDVAFLDIRMPGVSGINVARKIVGTCRVVFITAFDTYAVDAFENEAIDYILKPALPERLQKTISRIQKDILKDTYTQDISEVLERLSLVLEQPKKTSGYLKWIRAQVKQSVRLVPMEKVYFFQADNKYTRVVTLNSEVLIRKTISELAELLDPEMFFRIHRKTIVNAAFIEKIDKSSTSRGLVKLTGRPEIHIVSRRFTHLFRQM
jgi:DNA-binding LytR/AlgR family response regulator